MAFIYAVFFLLSVFFEAHVGAQQQNNFNFIRLGSSLSPTFEPTAWYSASSRFAFGFYPQGSGAFRVGIWLVGKPEDTVVWMANRDDPPVSPNATLEFTVNGLLLRTKQSEKKVIAHPSEYPAAFASVLDNGNFRIYTEDFGIIWQSFQYYYIKVGCCQVLARPLNAPILTGSHNISR